MWTKEVMSSYSKNMVDWVNYKQVAEILDFVKVAYALIQENLP